MLNRHPTRPVGPTPATRRRHGAALALLALLSLAGLAPRPAAPPVGAAAPFAYYTIADLGTPAGYDSSAATGINAAGQVAGYAGRYLIDLQNRAASWQGGTVNDLGTLPGGDASGANGINASGQIVGWSTGGGGEEYAVIWQGGTPTRLDPQWTGPSLARAINDSGQVVGRMMTANGTHAFVWQDGVTTDLGGLHPCSGYSEARGINALGHVVGKCGVFGGSHAVLWKDGAVTDLGTLPGLPLSVAAAINASGQIVGVSTDGGSQPPERAFLWQDGILAALAGLPGDGSRSAAAINDAGQIVGRAETGRKTHAVIWQDGAIADLNDFLLDGAGWELTEARAINALGQIAGRGYKDSRERAFLLTPTTPTIYTLSVTTSGAGTVTPGTDRYVQGRIATIEAQPASGQLLARWIVDGQMAGWGNPLTITMDGDRTVRAEFAPRPAFGDVPANGPAEAIAQLAGRTIIRGCDATATPPLFCPADSTLRHQMAALIVRAMPGWSDETYTNTFTDPTTDAELWRRVATLQHYKVAEGYNDCPAQGKTPPCYGPTDPVLYGQAISFITRAMIAKGYWTAQPAEPGLYGGVLVDTGHEQDVSTYRHYAGVIPGFPAYLDWYNTPGTFPFDQPAPRGWFAQALWSALNVTFREDQPGSGGYVR